MFSKSLFETVPKRLSSTGSPEKNFDGVAFPWRPLMSEEWMIVFGGSNSSALETATSPCQTTAYRMHLNTRIVGPKTWVFDHCCPQLPASISALKALYAVIPDA